MQQQAAVITLDGPGGSGKGTMAAWLAQRLGWHLLDSGALYRAVAWCYLAQQHPSLDDFVLRLSDHVDLQQLVFTADDGKPTQVHYAGQSITQDLRTERCANYASQLAALPVVREFLQASQRAFAKPPGLVADGRDMGTVIFPQAALKIFLTANAKARAQRRYAQLKQQGQAANLAAIEQDLAARDARDCTRKVAQLLAASDAVTIDSSELSVQEVKAQIWALVVAADLASAA